MTPAHDRGLAYDLATLLRPRPCALTRRTALRLLGGGVLLTLAGCSGNDEPTARATASGATSSGDCATIPGETAGPFPGDGSNGPNLLTESGVVRSDIRQSIGSANGTAQGIPVTLTLTVVDAANGCRPYEGAAVYLWHCDRDGGYSMYSPAVASENYLRGVQAADGSGELTFTTILPGAYPGRYPHAHFEVYESLAAATRGSNAVATSQLAVPAEVCEEAYGTSGYGASAGTFPRTPLARDGVFAHGAAAQLARATGSASGGYALTLTVPV